MNGDPVATLNDAIEQLEKSRRGALEHLTAATESLEAASKGRGAAAARDLKSAAKQVGSAAERVGNLQFHGSYKGTNASFLGAAERRLLSGIAIGAAALLASWVFLIATLAAAQLEPGQELALGGVWLLVGLVVAFLVTATLLAYGYRAINVSLRSVDGEIAELERSEDLRARRRLERQVAQATRDAERSTKRAEKADADAAKARAQVRQAEERAQSAASERDKAVAALSGDGNGAVDGATAQKAARAAKRTP